MTDQEHHLRTLIQTLERDNADLRAKLARLDGLTNWVCSCGGTDCKGQEENAALRNEVEEQARLNGKGSERELALRTTIDQLYRQNSELEKLIIKAGYIITCFDGKLALCPDPWHDRRKEQP